MIKGESVYDVDMIVQMPKELFQEKDYANLRYFYRRAYYLAYIAAHVKKELEDSLVFDKVLLNDNPLLPALRLRPSNTKGDAKHPSFSIRIIPCAPEGLFPTSKLISTSSCNKGADEEAQKKPTPFYNSTLKAEGTYVQYLRLLTHTKKECSAFEDACVLGRIWLKQRGFGGAISKGGFGHFEWAVMIALLLQTGGKNGKAVLSMSLSATELFKAAVQFLSTTDFNKKPFILGATTTPLEALKEAGPVMYDTARELNILAKMGPWSANLLRMQAKNTADLFADEAVDKFEPSVILKADGKLQMFDAVLEIKIPERQISNPGDCRSAAWDFGSEVHRVLKRAYGDRARLVHIDLPQVEPSNLDGSFRRSKTVLVSILYDPVHMPRSMEHGPPAEEQKEAARFRQFWGEKAELRRFKDGSILECVDWSDGRTDSAADLCEHIGQYALKRHLKVPAENIKFWGDAANRLLSLSQHHKVAFDAARRAFQTLERDIRGLEDLPLQIRQLSPISADARYASVQPPSVGVSQDHTNPMEVNLYFEVSNRWPENLTAIQQAKIEFLLDIDRRLTTAHENISTYLGRENIEVGVENIAYLDIVYETGVSFRLRIVSDLEEVLLTRQVLNKTLSPAVREQAEEALARLNWRFKTLPLHTQMVSTFCTRLPTLSGTIRLVKHWFDAHKLSGHFSEELIELIVMHIFLQPYPWDVPSSESAGLLRTLAFLSRWDWRDEPLIVDSAETMSQDDRAAVQHELQECRKRDPNLNRTVIIAAASHETSGTGYTRDGPSKLIAFRMTRLAKAAYKQFHDRDLIFSIEDLFETSLTDYDVLIRLSPKVLRITKNDAAYETGAKRPSSQFKNLDARTGRIPVPVRADPSEVLIGELSRVYADTLIFFRSATAGEDDDGIVGAIWDPRLQRQRFRTGLPFNFCKVGGEEGDMVEVNRKAVLSEIARIGGELIKKIEELDDDE
jgi:U3 small nucleolar RNA-associated protein 22